MILTLLKGIIIGIIVSAPMGPIGMLCVQRTLVYGRKVGMLTGYGATLSDLTYAFLTLAGVGAIIDIVTKYSAPLQFAGSIFIMGFAVYMMRSRHHIPMPKAHFPEEKKRKDMPLDPTTETTSTHKGLSKPRPNAGKANEGSAELEHKSDKQFFISAFLLTFSNVLIVLLYIGLFAQFSFVQPGATIWTLLIGLVGIGIGALTWWHSITHIIMKVSQWFNIRSLKWFNRGLGIILMIFGLYALITSFWEMWQRGSIAS